MNLKKTINPFLRFNGNCREAIEYYREIFNGNIELLMFAKGKFASENEVMHSVLSFYNGMIVMASDTRIGQEARFGNSNFVALNFQSEEEIDWGYQLFAKDAMQIAPTQTVLERKVRRIC